MNKLLMVFTTAILAGFGGVAYADIYGAGPAYGANPTGGIAPSRVLTVRNTPVDVTVR